MKNYYLRSFHYSGGKRTCLRLVDRCRGLVSMFLFCAVLILFVSVSVAQLPPGTRAQQLLQQMTLDEKLQMVHGINTQNTYVGIVPAIPRLKVPRLTLQDGPQGFYHFDRFLLKITVQLTS